MSCGLNTKWFTYFFPKPIVGIKSIIHRICVGIISTVIINWAVGIRVIDCLEVPVTGSKRMWLTYFKGKQTDF